MAKPIATAVEGAETRINSDELEYIHPQMRLLHDPAISFEEYDYYARKTREEEESHVSHDTEKKSGLLSKLIPSKSSKGAGMDGSDEKRRESLVPAVNTSDPSQRMHISDEEWTNASRALRTATAGAIFYLITTDILGPFGLPYAFASTGWGPGVALYTAFGLMAGVSGWLLYKCFLGLDSYEFPIRHYGDIAFRTLGRTARHGFNILQSIQLLCNVGIIMVSNGEALSEATHFGLCYAICVLIWCLAGFFFGQIRTLQKLGWLANLAVWINLLIMFLTMGFAAHSDPYFEAGASAAGGSIGDGSSVTQDPATGQYPPVRHSGGLPDQGDFVAAINGLMQAVYAYSGAMLFPEFMAEMKRPADFLKGMWGAQLFIYVCYMVYGLFMYGYQGQYVQNPSYLGIAPYSWQTAGNVLAMITALIAASLYGNIGFKVVYNNVFVELFKAPPLTQKSGKYLWAALIPVYWAICFVIAAGIPDFSGLVSIVSAFCSIHFTYTFPPMLHLAYNIKAGAMLPGEGFDPATGKVTRFDGGFKRVMRGFMNRKWVALNVWNVIYIGGALATSGLGAYSAIEGLIEAFQKPQINAYGCTSPLEG